MAGAFTDEPVWREAAVAARRRGSRFEIYTPFSDEETVRELNPHSPQHPVRLWTLLGGIFGGVVVAFCMVIWMSRDWPLVVGGKPIVSWPPFICICFEMTVLYAAFACMFAFFAYARIPHLTMPAAYRPEFMHDHFGLFLACGPEQVDELRHQLVAEGAIRTWPVYNPPRGRLADPYSLNAAALTETPSDDSRPEPGPEPT